MPHNTYSTMPTTFPLTSKPRQKGIPTLISPLGSKMHATIITQLLFRLTSASTSYGFSSINYRLAFEEARDYVHRLLCKSSKLCKLIPLALLYVKRIAILQRQAPTGSSAKLHNSHNFAPGSEKYLLGVALMIAQKHSSGILPHTVF
jgi:hypothetical protein